MSKRRLPVLAALSAAGLSALVAVPMASAQVVSTCRVTYLGATTRGDTALQAAVDAAAANPGDDTISVRGTCVGAIRLIDSSGKVTIRGTGDRATLDAQNNPLAGSVVTVESGTTAEIRGLKITGGTGALSAFTIDVGFGGGIYNRGTLTVRSSRVTGNAATGPDTEGGGIFSAGPLTVIDSRVDGNTAALGGGGIAARGTLTVRGSRVEANTAGVAGGGIVATTNSSTTASITNSRVNGNTAPFEAGGIFSKGYTLTILRSQINGNTTSNGYGGGGIVNVLGSLTLTKSQVNRNTSGGVGGGIANFGGSVALVESQVNSNSAGTDGGGIWNGYNGSFATVSICPKSKVQHNTAGGYGGGIWADALGTVRDGSGLTPYSGTGVAYNTSINGTSTGNSPADLINIFEVM